MSDQVMSADADRIREEIRRTQENLSTNVDALAYKANPRRMVRERTDRIRTGLRRAKDSVMGVASSAGDQAGAAASSVEDMTSSVVDATGEAAARVKRTAEGNPIAAGLIVFGAAWLVSSLLPRTELEAQAAEAVKDIAREPASAIAVAVGEAAHEVTEHMKEPTREAAESVKETATDAARAVQDQTREAAQEVRDDAERARHRLTE